MILALAACATLGPVENLTMWPGTGQTEVSTDTQVYVAYRGSSPVLADPGVALLTEAGELVPSTTIELPAPGPDRHVFLLIPDEPLAPGARYDVADEVDWACAAEPCRIARTAKHVFTTGDGPDLDAPAAPPAPVVADQRDDSCDGARGIVTTLENPATGAIRYDLYDRGALVESAAPFVIATDCDGGFDTQVPSVPLAPGHHELTFRGYDLAGNEAIGAGTLTLDLACPADPDPEPDPDEEDGCDAGAGGLGLLAGLLAAPLLGRRRRTR